MDIVGSGGGSGAGDSTARIDTFRAPPPQCCDEFLMGGGLGPSEENPPTVPTENVRLTSVFAKAYQYAQKDLFPVFERKTPPKPRKRVYMIPE